MKNNNHLGPCPLCGGRLNLVEVIKSDGKCSYKDAYIECTRCVIRSKDFNIDGYYGMRAYTKKEIIEEWNNWTSPAKNETPLKQLCPLWNPGHHGLPQRCELCGDYRICTCGGNDENCNYKD